MAIRRQIWRPDTHSGVEILQEYDDTDYDGTVRVISITRDGVKQEGAEAETDYTKIQSENRKKNTDIVPELEKSLTELEMRNVRYSVKDGKIEVNLDHIKDIEKRNRALSAVRDRQL